MILTENELQRIILDELRKTVFKEGLRHHYENKIPVHESIYRVGSPCYFNVIKQAREFYRQGLYEVVNQKRKRKILPLVSQHGILALGRSIKCLFVTQKQVRSRRLLTVTPKVVLKAAGTALRPASRLPHVISAPRRKIALSRVTGLVERIKILDQESAGSGNGFSI